MPETSYAPCGDLSLAYQVFGDGPVELVFAGSFASHVELYWTVPEFEAFFEQLSTFCRVLLFDKAGVGLSDPVPQVRTLDDRAAEIEAVMDAAGFGKSGPLRSERGRPGRHRLRGNTTAANAGVDPHQHVRVLASPTAGTTWTAIRPSCGRASLPELGEDYTPSAEQLARCQEFGRAVRSAWGSGAALKALLPSVRSIRQLAMLERMSASPGMARATLEAMFRIDVRPILPTITVPTLVIHARDERRSGAVRPVPRRPHPRRAVARSRRQRTTRPGSPIPTGS